MLNFLKQNKSPKDIKTLRNDLLDFIKDQLKKDQVTTRAFWNEGISIADEIVKYIYNTNIELVVVTSGLDVTSKPKYIGPHAQKIIHCSKAPVLSIKKNTVPSFV